MSRYYSERTRHIIKICLVEFDKMRHFKVGVCFSIRILHLQKQTNSKLCVYVYI